MIDFTIKTHFSGLRHYSDTFEAPSMSKKLVSNLPKVRRRNAFNTGRQTAPALATNSASSHLFKKWLMYSLERANSTR